MNQTLPQPRHKIEDIIDGSKGLLFDFALHEIDDIKEALKGQPLEGENLILLLRARIADISWCYSYAGDVFHAAEEHIKKLESELFEFKKARGDFDYAKGT